MPYKIVKSGSGYKVKSPHRSFSKKPMSKERARQQQKAIYANAGPESYQRRLERALIEGTIDPSSSWSSADYQVAAVNLVADEDQWDDPGDYPSGAGGRPQPSRSFTAEVRGEIVFTLSDRVVDEFSAWMDEGGDLPAAIVRAAAEAASDVLPDVRVRGWDWKLVGNDLHLRPEGFNTN